MTGPGERELKPAKVASHSSFPQVVLEVRSSVVILRLMNAAISPTSDDSIARRSCDSIFHELQGSKLLNAALPLTSSVAVRLPVHDPERSVPSQPCDLVLSRLIGKKKLMRPPRRAAAVCGRGVPRKLPCHPSTKPGYGSGGLGHE